MPEQFDNHPEELLPGSDRPRPLSPALRERLQRSLLNLPGSGDPAACPSAPSLAPLPAGPPAPAPRPLSPEVRDRLEHRLRRPGPGRSPGPWKRIVPGAGVAAAIAVLAAIVVPQLVNSPHKPGGTVAAKDAVPSVERLGLALPSTAVNGRSDGKGAGAPGVLPRRSGPARLAPNRPKVRVRPAAVPGPVAGVVDAPVVTAVNPARGPAGGGNWVVVDGRGFAEVSAVDFGASAAVSFVVESPLRLKVKAPAHAPGTVDIVVAGASGRSTTSPLDRYRFGP